MSGYTLRVHIAKLDSNGYPPNFGRLEDGVSSIYHAAYSTENLEELQKIADKLSAIQDKMIEDSIPADQREEFNPDEMDEHYWNADYDDDLEFMDDDDDDEVEDFLNDDDDFDDIE